MKHISTEENQPFFLHTIFKETFGRASVALILKFSFSLIFFGVMTLSCVTMGQVLPNQVNTRMILTMDKLECFGKTETGDDEVYIIVNWRVSNGQYGTFRIPGPIPNSEAGHWNMNVNPNSVIPHWQLFFADLAPGMSVDISVFIMEEDNGGSQQIIDKVQNLMTTIGGPVAGTIPATSPYIAAISEVISFIKNLPFQINDSDDYIGSFSVHVENRNGFLTTQYSDVQRSTAFGPWPNYDPNIAFRTMGTYFIGDGSRYEGRFIVHYP